MSEIIRVIKDENYTVMSNIHLRDSNISLQAKGLMSLVLSFPPNWKYTIKGLETYATNGRDSFSTTLNELEHNYYLYRERERNERGQLKDNIYIFYENPKQNPRYEDKSAKKADTQSKSRTMNTPLCENSTISKTVKGKYNVQGSQSVPPITAFPEQEQPAQENPTLLNTNIVNTKRLNTDISSSSEIVTVKIDDDEIKRMIGYSNLVTLYSQKQVDEIFFILSDIFKLNSRSVRINGNSVSTADVKTEMSKLEVKHIRYVLDCVTEQTGIRNRRAYILTALYNARRNFDMFESADTTDSGGHSYDLNEIEQYALNFGMETLKVQ